TCDGSHLQSPILYLADPRTAIGMPVISASSSDSRCRAAAVLVKYSTITPPGCATESRQTPVLSTDTSSQVTRSEPTMKKLITHSVRAIGVPTRKLPFVHTAAPGHGPHGHNRDNNLVGITYDSFPSVSACKTESDERPRRPLFE